MKQLMMYNMPELIKVTFERNQHTVLEKLGYSAYSFGKVFIYCIILLEFIV
jgi:hypothetical protein